MKKIIGIILAVWLCGTAFGVNFSYTGNGTDPNDWFDAGNWSHTAAATNWPTAVDNALYVTAGKDMVISQVVSEHSQFQVGRGVVNMVTIAPGGVVTNSNQTIAGILNNGKGTLVIDGGTLVTKQIQINPAGGTGFVPSTETSMQIKDGSVQVGLGGGNILMGVNAPATLEVSGGSLGIDGLFRFFSGTFAVKGSAGTISIDSELQFGTTASSSAELKFVLGADGAVSKISADSISFLGENTLTIDGTFDETDSEQTVVLIELTGSDTFSGEELTALNNSLQLVNVSSGSLSLSGDSKQLIFTGKPEARKLMKAWEFNTVGDTEGWAGYTGNTHLSGVGVSNAINGSETVLTCSDVTGIDGQLVYNESLAPESAISLGGDSWRTLEFRVRQLDANPGEAGVASKLFDSSGATTVLSSPFTVTGLIENENALCSVKLDSDNWIIATYDISGFGMSDLTSLRIDPIGNAVNTNYNFELDYVRVYAGATQSSVERQEIAWEFNTTGDVEGWTGNAGVIGLTASLDIDGSNSVMTCSSTTGDPQWSYTNGVAGAAGSWETLKFRARQLVDGVVTNWDSGGTVAVITGVANITGFVDATDRVTQTDETNGWTIIELDISECTADTISSIRLDFTGAPRTIEVDWIRISKYATLSPYESWASYYGLTVANNAPTDDPDNDTFNNLYEYAFGGDPADDQISGASPFAAGIAAGGALNYVYLKNSSPYSTLNYSLEYTDDLVNGTWSNLTGSVESGTGAFTSDLNAVTNQIPTDLPAKFIRTKAE
jgi:hypothetical protein